MMIRNVKDFLSVQAVSILADLQDFAEDVWFITDGILTALIMGAATWEGGDDEAGDA